MPERLHTFRLTLKIDGQNLADDVFALVEEAVVDARLHLPAMFEIHFNDIDGDVLEKSKAKVGSAIEISSTAVGAAAVKPLFKGEITAFEGDYHERGRRVVLRGYDVAHRLQRGRYTRTWENATDSDIAKKIAREHNIQPGKIDDTTIQYEHVSQAATSDWDFLKARARKCGRELTVTDGKLNFAKPTPASGAPSAGRLTSEDPLQLVFGQSLLNFRPRLTAGDQVTKVAVRGWDIALKKEAVGQTNGATKAAAPAGGDTPSAIANKVGSTAPYTAVEIPVEKANVATNVAEALAEEIASAFFEADGVALGDPGLKAGAAVSISGENGVSSKFAGKYVLSHVCHVFDFTGTGLAYTTRFEISGRQERTLLGLASLGQTNGLLSNSGERIYGLVVGIVTQNDDSKAKDGKKMGRVKVKFPWLDDKYESGWARVAQFGAGPTTGAMFMPEVNDEVLVGFEHGDVQRPYVIGGLYNGVDLPPDVTADSGKSAPFSPTSAIASGKVKHRGFVSRKGHRLAFVDDDEKPGIYIKSSDGKLKIEIKEKEKELRITGDQKIFIEAAQELHLISKKDMTIKADGNIKLQAQMNAEMKAGTGFKVEGAQVNVKGSATAEFAGATTTIKGDAMVQVQAPMVKVG